MSTNNFESEFGGKFLSKNTIWWEFVVSEIFSLTSLENSVAAGLVLYANSSCLPMSGLVDLIQAIISALTWSLSIDDTLKPMASS